MGEPCRRATQRPLPCADSLRDRHLHSRPPAQPAVHPGDSAGVLLPQVQGRQRQRLASDAAVLMRHSRAYPLRSCAGLHEGGAAVRAVLRQLHRPELQLRGAHLRRAAHRSVHMVGIGALPPAQPDAHQGRVLPEHTVERHTLRRPRIPDTRVASDRACGLPDAVLPARAGAHIQRDSAEHICDIHRLLLVCPTADTRRRQHADEPERPRQRVRPGLVHEPRTVRRQPAFLRAHVRRGA